MAQGMKRLGMPIAALFGVAVLTLIGTSWFLNRDALRQAVEAQIRAVTGLDLVITGRSTSRFFPAATSPSMMSGSRAAAPPTPRCRSMC